MKKMKVSLLFLGSAAAWTFPFQAVEPRQLNLRQLQLVPAPTLIPPVAVSNSNSTEPTAAPTESPAPSPSPSAVPTMPPSLTAKPTPSPTAAPTESPAPSPSPSSVPTNAPTKAPSATPSMQPTTTRFPTMSPSAMPSDAPSSTPSASPSASPTVSTQPSTTPSVSPSATPSVSPSVSLMPSDSPSVAPSTSTQPSSMPTYIGTSSAVFTAVLNLTQPLSLNDQLAFIAGTEEWIPQADLGPGSALSMASVEILFQELSPDNTTLAIDFAVTAVYTGSDTDFDLQSTLQPLFDEPNPLWIHFLGNYGDVFLALRPPPVIPGAEQDGSSSQTTLSAGGLSAIVVVVLASVVLAVGASVFSIRSHHTAVRGEELPSPTSYDNDRGQLGFVDTSPTFDNVTESIVAAPEPMMPDNEDVFDNVTDTTMKQDAPDYMPRVSEVSSIADLFHANNIGRMDPPTKSEVDYEQYRTKPSLFESATSMSELSEHQRRNNTRSYNNAQYLYDPHNEVEQDLSHELTLTKSMGGTLGAEEYQRQQQQQQQQRASSDYTASQATSLFSSQVSAQQHPTLGARPLRRLDEQPRHDPYQQPTAGLYDVFAPAGPIGIVVDTTKDGPAVHSLKPNSPMMGLINPGDLIVGLDDQDTRSMTAATLTRLMAKKAGQKERKITLLACD